MEYMTTTEAAQHLRLSPSTLAKYRVHGSGPQFLKLGKKVVYEKADLDAWATERSRASTSDGGQQ